MFKLHKETCIFCYNLNPRMNSLYFLWQPQSLLRIDLDYLQDLLSMHQVQNL